MLQSLVEPCDQGFGLGVLGPVVTTVIYRQVMVTVQFKKDIGKLAAQTLMPWLCEIILLYGKELPSGTLWHLRGQEVNHPIGLFKQVLDQFVRIH